MILLYKTPSDVNGFVKCTKTKKPKMSSHRGRTWLIMNSIIVVDNEQPDKIELYMNTWSSWYYFKVNNQWYKANDNIHKFGYMKHYYADFSNERKRE